jgi:hypothetical protein
VVRLIVSGAPLEEVLILKKGYWVNAGIVRGRGLKRGRI